MITATSKHLADKITQHGSEYMVALEPFIIERRPNGDVVCDDTHPAWQEMVAKYRKSSVPIVTEYPNGLGTLTRNGIDMVSLGLAKPLAEAIARTIGQKNCGCTARQTCLNLLVPDIRKMTLADWVRLTPKILTCTTAA